MSYESSRKGCDHHGLMVFSFVPFWHAYSLILLVARNIVPAFCCATGCANSLLSGIPYLPAFPVAFVVSLYSLVLYARAKLGAWPAPYAPDPKTIGISYVIFHLLTFGLLCGFLFAVLRLSRGGHRIRSFRQAIPWAAITIVSWGLFVIVVRYDPGSYIEWLYD